MKKIPVFVMRSELGNSRTKESEHFLVRISRLITAGNSWSSLLYCRSMLHNYINWRTVYLNHHSLGLQTCTFKDLEIVQNSLSIIWYILTGNGKFQNILSINFSHRTVERFSPANEREPWGPLRYKRIQYGVSTS